MSSAEGGANKQGRGKGGKRTSSTAQSNSGDFVHKFKHMKQTESWQGVLFDLRDTEMNARADKIDLNDIDAVEKLHEERKQRYKEYTQQQQEEEQPRAAKGQPAGHQAQECVRQQQQQQQELRGKRRNHGSTPHASAATATEKEAASNKNADAERQTGGVDVVLGLGGGEARGGRIEGVGGGQTGGGLETEGGTGGQGKGNGGEREDAQGRTEEEDDTDGRLSRSIWREAVNSAPLHPCELSSGDLISVDGSNYTVKKVLKKQLKIEVARTDNEDIKLVLDFHELFLNPTFSTNSRRDAGWGEGDMTVGNSTILNMSILEFTRICLMSGLDINPRRIDFVGKSPKACLECLNTQYITAKRCSKEKTLTALLTSKLQNRA
jgi:hypothetical protein